LPFMLSSYSLLVSVPRPALHSFPTRRSSDLLVRQAQVSHLKKRRCCVVRSSVHRGPRDRACAEMELLLAFRAGRFGRGNPLHSSDRKSTRLNSSHRTISYAVFCLKKKNNSRK